ncbi:MAG: hypothetical protein HY761_01485 [Candidatus Omnitrophica bacterium]|nr:hypothetical protein [Candidatus Omnitrophota bacterium]
MFMRSMGLFAIVPTTLLLTVSFFVLLAVRKIEAQGLKAFGYVVAAFLWISSLLMLSGGIFTVATGKPLMRCPMMEMMKSDKRQMSKECMGSGMMKKDQMPNMPMQDDKGMMKH